MGATSDDRGRSGAGEGSRGRAAARFGGSRLNAPIGVSFLIPAYNEAATIGEVLERIDALDIESQIVVVDDGSTDATASIVEAFAADRPYVELLRQPNRGKGSAVRRAATRITQDIAVIQDADMEYDPADVLALIAPIERGVADVVYGSRLSGGAPQRAYLFWHLVGNRFLSLLTGILFNTTLSDMETGYKAFRSDVLRSLRLEQDDFAIEPEITGEVCRRELRIYEMPIAYYGRTYAEGKNITWRDGLKAVRVLVQVRLRRG
jgi:glycosyltransferase involved in cell wall biosynthesis